MSTTPETIRHKYRLRDLHTTSYFQNGEIMVDEQGQNYTRNQQELNPEGVMIVVVGGTEFQIHQVQGSEWRYNEDKFHEGVVDADEGGYKIQVTT